MLPIKTLAKRIRIALHDEKIVTYDEEDIIEAINYGIRFVRRTIADYRPGLLADNEITGLLEAGESSITLERNPMMIVSFRMGDEIASSVKKKRVSSEIWHNWTKIYHNRELICPEYTVTTYRTKLGKEIFDEDILDASATGRVWGFYRVGLRTLKLFPIPNRETYYSLVVINDIEEVTIEDNSPLLNEFDDFIVEYANLRLSIGNEYDVTQESTIMSNIVSQLVNALHVPSNSLDTFGYWDMPAPRRRW